MNGELHPSKNRSKDGLRHLVPTFLLMDGSANELLCISGVTIAETAMGIAMLLPRGCLAIFTLRDAIIPLVRS